MTIFEIAVDVARRLESIGIEYAVGGSVASSTWGQMRQTNDIDIAAIVRAEQFELLAAAFPDPYYISRDELKSAMSSAEEFRAVQILHIGEAFKIDLFLLFDDLYGRSEMDRARLMQGAPGEFIKFCAPENIIIAKLRWFVAGNRVSDRQWNDIVQVLEVQAGHLDDDYLDTWAEHFGVLDLLAAARIQA